MTQESSSKKLGEKLVMLVVEPGVAGMKKLIEATLDKFVDDNTSVIVPTEFQSDVAREYCKTHNKTYSVYEQHPGGSFIEYCDYMIMIVTEINAITMGISEKRSMTKAGKICIVLEVNRK